MPQGDNPPRPVDGCLQGLIPAFPPETWEIGHVDGVGTVEETTRVESTTRVRVALPGRELAPLLIPQGSVAVDGVSLTVAALGDRTFEVMLIPHTLAVTSLGRLAPGQAVNIEADVIGKYLVRSLALRGTT